MDTNFSSLPGLERISSSCSSSSLYTISTQSSSPDTLMMDDPQACFDYLQPSPTTSTATIPSTCSKKRKRQTSATMIIKPTRWSPPPPPQLNPQRQSTTPRNGTIENDFKPTFYNPNEIKHRRRVSSYQYSVLEEEYRANNKPNASKRHQLADRLGMTPRTVQIWFQNKRAKAKQQQQQSNKTISPSQQSHGVPDSSSTATTPQEMVTFDDGRLDPIYLLGDMATFASLSSSPPAIAKSGPVVPPDSCNAVTAPMAGSEVISDHGTGEIASTSSSSLSSPRLPDTYYAYNDPFPMWLHPHANQQQQQIATDNTVIGDPFALLQQLTDHMGNDQRRDSILHWIQKTPTDPGVPIWPSSIIQDDYLDSVLDQDDWFPL